MNALSQKKCFSLSDLENGECGHRIYRWDEWAKGKALLEVELIDKPSQAHQVDPSTHHQGRYGRAHNSKEKDASQVQSSSGHPLNSILLTLHYQGWL